MKHAISIAAASLVLGGCSLADLVSGNAPPVTIVQPAQVKPRIAPECFDDKDPKPPGWVERDESRDVFLTDEMRREAENKERQLAFARIITKQRRVCSAGLKVLAR